MRVLIWNLYHGRARPPAGRDLQADYTRALAGWEWDVALLQEVPPWWPADLPGTDRDTVLTSRNLCLCLRRPLARRWPDLLKSQGGGANAILVRDGTITARARRRLRLRPERRMAHGVKVAGTWFVNLHLTAHVPQKAAEDMALAVDAANRWAGAAPLVFGGDFNLRKPTIPGLTRVGSRDVDHLFVRGFTCDAFERLEHGALSDHPPLRATLSPSAGRSPAA